MSNNKWHIDNLRRLLISQQEEYQRLGLEHKLYAETDKAFYSQWLHHRSIILSLIPEECRKQGTKVIDIGGGKGRMSALLSGLGLECVNIDCLYSETETLNTEGKPLIPLLKNYCEKKGVRVLANDFDQKGIPFADDTFDLAIFSEVIEHLPNSPKPLLSEIYRTLRTGGYLILTTPNMVARSNRLRVVLGRSIREPIETFYKMEGYPPGSIYRGHNREYVLHEVEYMLTQENFDIIHAQTCDYSPQLMVSKIFHKIADSFVDAWHSDHLGIKEAFITWRRKMDKIVSFKMGHFIVVLARK
jgi:SAM-dependent methyltransferase